MPDSLARLDAVVTSVAVLARAAGREDLAEAVTRDLDDLRNARTTVLVAGEFGGGRSAVVNGILGAAVCGVSAIRTTAVPTVVRHGQRARAWAVRGEGDSLARSEVQPGTVADLALAGDGLSCLEVELPRAVLAKGLVLVDLPGTGGGIAAQGASAVIRGAADADAVLYVADSATELTVADLDLIAEMAGLCPAVSVVLTKVDLHPHWRQIAEIDRAHLRARGLDVPVTPVSSVLRELALATGDPAMNAESGYPILVSMLDGPLRGHQANTRTRRVLRGCHGVLVDLAAQLREERLALVNDPDAKRRLEELERSRARAEELVSNAARWRELFDDQFEQVRRDTDRDLGNQRRAVQDAVQDLIDERDPAAEWEQTLPAMMAEITRRVSEHHRFARDCRTKAAAQLAEALDTEVGDLLPVVPSSGAPASYGASPDLSPGSPGSPGSAGASSGAAPGSSSGTDPADDADGLTSAARTPTLRRGRLGLADLSMNAARGFSLGLGTGGSVAAGVAAVLSLSVAPVAVPIGALLGGAFAVRTIRTARETHLGYARQEARQVAARAMDDAFRKAAESDADDLMAWRRMLRERLGELAARAHRQATATAQAAREASTLADADRAERLRTVDDLLSRVERWRDALGELEPGSAKGAAANGAVPGGRAQDGTAQSGTALQGTRS